MNQADDRLVQRAVDELRRLPAVDAEAVRRTVQAAAAARVAPADVPMDAPARRGRSIRLRSAASLAAAAAIVGFVAHGAWLSKRADRPTTTAAVSADSSLPRATTPTRLVASSRADVAAIPQQFVLQRTGARRVSVVGDFNRWDPSSAPMTRASDGTFWSAIIPMSPGRHIYGFMIDDSLFVLDPRAPTARDPDLGTDGSVRMVGVAGVAGWVGR